MELRAIKPQVISMRRLATGRIIGLLIAIAGTGVAIWCAYDALQLNAEFNQWLVARPMETPIDLSQPGETSVPFHQTCSISHGEALCLKCDLPDGAKRDLEELFKDLSATVAIKDADGSEIQVAKIDRTTVHHWADEIILAGLARFRNGEYIADIRVESGAANLSGKQQMIYAKYQLCGLERMPATIAGALAVGAGIVGLVSVACVLPGLWRAGIWRTVSRDGA